MSSRVHRGSGAGGLDRVWGTPAWGDPLGATRLAGLATSRAVKEDGFPSFTRL